MPQQAELLLRLPLMNAGALFWQGEPGSERAWHCCASIFATTLSTGPYESRATALQSEGASAAEHISASLCGPFRPQHHSHCKHKLSSCAEMQP